MKTKVECPYCKHENWISVQNGIQNQRQIVICDSEKGGCDRVFVAITHVSIIADCRKVEGE